MTMIVAAIVLVMWVVFGRITVGALGSLVWVYAFGLGVPLMALHTAAAVLFARDAKFYPSESVSLRASLTAMGSWIVTALFGFFLPDSTSDGMESVFTALTGPNMSGISYGFANTFGVISMAMAVAWCCWRSPTSAIPAEPCAANRSVRTSYSIAWRPRMPMASRGTKVAQRRRRNRTGCDASPGDAAVVIAALFAG